MKVAIVRGWALQVSFDSRGQLVAAGFACRQRKSDDAVVIWIAFHSRKEQDGSRRIDPLPSFGGYCRGGHVAINGGIASFGLGPNSEGAAAWLILVQERGKR